MIYLRKSVILGLVLFCGACTNMRSGNGVKLQSPDKHLEASFTISPAGNLTYTLNQDENTVVLKSGVSITIDGIEYGRGFQIEKVEYSSQNSTYPWIGKKSVGVDHFNALTISLRSNTDKMQLEARLYNDGFAYRYMIPGTGTRTIQSEKIAWNLPFGSSAWYHSDVNTYQGIHNKVPLSQLKAGINMAPPITVELPDRKNFAVLTEAGAFTYSGMSIRSAANGQLQGVLLDDPKGWQVTGKVCSPWRVTMVGDLDTIVNSMTIYNLSPEADTKLYPEGVQTAWVNSGIGRMLWQWFIYLDPGMKWPVQKKFVDYASMLNCRHYLVDAGWENPSFGWMDNGKDSWKKLKELCDYGADRGVSIWVWRGCKNGGQGPGIWTLKEQDEFLSKCRECGVKGIKIDYMNSESAEVLKFYQRVALCAAKYNIMVSFHGANKPRGERKTWPNELVREGVSGLEEHRVIKPTAAHYASLPFTRCIAGHADITPTSLQKKWLNGTSFASQLAHPIVVFSPVLCWGDDPLVYLNSPAVEYIRSVPTVWDETRVLPGSKIGELAAFARRSGSDWYAGIVNGGGAKDYSLDLSFLGTGKYIADIYADDITQADNLVITQAIVDKGDKLPVAMRKGGGYVVKLSKMNLSQHGGAFRGTMTVSIQAASTDTQIHYTLDGTKADKNSPHYRKPIHISQTTNLRAVIVVGDGVGSEINETFYRLK